MLNLTKNKKHRLLIELLYGSGLRVSEAISLRINDQAFISKVLPGTISVNTGAIISLGALGNEGIPQNGKNDEVAVYDRILTDEELDYFEKQMLSKLTDKDLDEIAYLGEDTELEIPKEPEELDYELGLKPLEELENSVDVFYDSL